MYIQFEPNPSFPPSYSPPPPSYPPSLCSPPLLSSFLSSSFSFLLSEVKLSRAIKSSTPSGQVPSEKDYFQVTDELSKENSHFALSEALLAVIEQVRPCLQYTNSTVPIVADTAVFLDLATAFKKRMSRFDQSEWRSERACVRTAPRSALASQLARTYVR